MEQLIFFAVLIFFSIIESIARSRKQRQGGGPLPDLPPEEEAESQRPPRRRPPVPRPRTSIPPSYDDDASFDARVPADEARSLESESYDQAAASEAERRRRASSSESMIPAELWEELAGLAGGAKVELPKPQPRLPPPQQRRAPAPKLPAPSPRARPHPTPAPVREPRAPARRQDTEGTASHPVHLSHAGYGTDPSQRSPSTQDVIPPLASGPGADAAAVRRQLRGQGASALRQAVILQEILGPPAASKPDRFSE